VISIRRRLLVYLLALFASAWALLAILSYSSAQHEIEELFDAELAQQARVLLGITLHERRVSGKPDDVQIEVIGTKAGHDYEEKIAFQIWVGQRLIRRSQNAPQDALTATDGYSERAIGGHRWRVFGLSDKANEIRVLVGQRTEVRDELIGYIIHDLLLPLLLVAPVIAFLVWSGVGAGLAPLRRLATEILRRSPQQLEPVNIENTPREVQPIVDSLNRLLTQLDSALEAERRFTFNAAHELRTPLAALKTQAQVALRATNSKVRTQAVHQTLAGVDRASHLVGQLLTLARLDPDAAMASYTAIDLVHTARAVVADLAPQAIDKGVEIAFQDTNVSSRIHGDSAAIAILLRNLVDNAIRYTPAGGRVEVTVHEVPEQVVMAVTDSGPGIPETERQNVLSRFYRLPGSSGAGCGLGLSIVQRIAELHRARLELATAPDGHGLQVTVRFPIEPGGHASGAGEGT